MVAGLAQWLLALMVLLAGVVTPGPRLVQPAPVPGEAAQLSSPAPSPIAASGAASQGAQGMAELPVPPAPVRLPARVAEDFPPTVRADGLEPRRRTIPHRRINRRRAPDDDDD